MVTLAGCDQSQPVAAVEGPAGNPDRVEALTEKQVKRALLTVDDLPAGWSADAAPTDTSSDSDSTITPPQCGELFDSLANTQQPVAKATADFTAGGIGPLLSHTVSAFESEVAERLERITKVLAECPAFTSRDGKKATTFEAAALSFPNLGDRTLALRLNGATQGFDVVMDVIVIAAGGNGVSLVAGGLTPVPGATLQEIAKTAMTKLADVT